MRNGKLFRDCSLVRQLEPAFGAHREAFQRELARQLAGQSLLDRNTLHLGRIQEHDGIEFLIGGDAQKNVWPFGDRISLPDSVGSDVCSELNLRPIRNRESAFSSDVVTSGCRLATVDEQVECWRETYGELFAREPAIPELPPQGFDLISDIDRLADGRIGVPQVDLTMQLTAHALLQVWSRWLGRFAGSSRDYLLKNFILRPGRLRCTGSTLHVEMQPVGLDVVLKLSGYTSPLENVAWLNGLTVVFEISEDRS